MLKYTIKIRLRLEGPVLSHSTAAGEYGIDNPMARNRNNRYYLPGSLVKGKLREAMRELKTRAGDIFDPNIEDLLGEETGNDKNSRPDILPRRSRLIFEDFLSETKVRNQEISRIKMEPTLGSVKKGMLQVMEAPWASGEETVFSGSVSLFAADDKDCDRIRKYLETGLRWITSFGSNRSVGFGRLLGIEIESAPAVDLNSTGGIDDLGSAECFDLSISPDNPFCISKHRVSENIFESEQIIPGNVIKGCIAELWRQLLEKPPGLPVNEFDDSARKELMGNFDRIRFTHAFPAHNAQAKRPVMAPLSIVKVNEDKYDVALCEKPVLIRTRDNLSAPTFRVDWKSTAKVDEKFGWSTDENTSLKTELRVRTAIDSENRKAADKQLFAYEMIVPDNHTWHSKVDLSDITDETVRAAAIKQLQQLLTPGLMWLGKTKTHAEVRIINPGSPTPPAVISRTAPQEGYWIVTLQTPAILCNPYELNEASGMKELHDSYSKAWDDLSENNLELSHYFASQSLAGGFYVHRRFRSNNLSYYYPFMLTDAGSVFVFKAKGDLAQEKIEAWLKHGLELPKWAKERYAAGGLPGDQWQNCPYIRQNGYGEIAVNIDHQITKPKEGDCHVIESLVD